MSFICVAWNNGRQSESGAGYGIKISIADRDKHFSPSWRSVVIELPIDREIIEVEVNVSKQSFWSKNCRELISKKIGQWLQRMALAPWPLGRPPRFSMSPVGPRRFRVSIVP